MWSNVCVKIAHGARLFGESFFALDHFSIDFMKVNFTDFVHNVLVVEGDKTKSPVSVGYLVICQHGLLDL